jgi:hypothetical protein
MATTNFYWASQTAITLTSTGGSTTNGSYTAAGTDLDVRSGGNASLLTDFDFLLICQVATATGIALGTIMADLYALPKLDGTNLPQIDTASAAAYAPNNFRVGSFIAAKILTTSTDTYFAITGVLLKPNLYTLAIINRCGQTISANWTLKAYCTNMTGV